MCPREWRTAKAHESIRRVKMGTHLLFQACFLLGALMFCSKGASTGLECLSCVDIGDGGCGPQKMNKTKCPPTSQVCVETVAAVQWSHGNFLIGEKGCGLGIPGFNDKAVELHGIVAFSKLHQCNSSHCNNKLDHGALQLQSTGNESAMVPNGVECYSCSGDACLTDNTTIVKCYNNLRGCFHGNVTMRAGKFSMTRPVKGCVQDEECTKVTRGSPAITLVGSCCAGSLCNVDLSNKTYFAPKIPGLAILPDESANVTTGHTTTSGHTRHSLPTPTPADKQTSPSPVTTSLLSHDHDHDHDHDHGHDHGHDHSHAHNQNDKETFTGGNEYFINAVKVEERKHQQVEHEQVEYSGSVAVLGGLFGLVLPLTWLLM